MADGFFDDAVPMKNLVRRVSSLRRSLNFEPGSKTRNEVEGALKILGSRARAALRRRLRTSQYGTNFGAIASKQLYDAFQFEIEAEKDPSGRTTLMFRFGVSDAKNKTGNRRAPSFYYPILDTASDFDTPTEERIKQWLADRGDPDVPLWKVRAIVAIIKRKQRSGAYKALRLTETLERSLSLKRTNNFVQAVRKSITFQ